MKFRFIFIALFLFSRSGVNCQPARFSLLINIIPARGSEASIRINKDSVYLEINRDYTPGNYYYAAMPVNKTEAARLQDFMNLYSFPQKSLTAPEPIHRQINGKDSITGYIYQILSDGLKVTGVYSQGIVSQPFQFYSLRREDENYNLITLVFDVLDKTFRNAKTYWYIMNLKGEVLGPYLAH